MSNLKCFTIILTEFHFIALGGKSVPQKTAIFLEIFHILPLPAAAPIFFFVWPIDVKLTCHVY